MAGKTPIRHCMGCNGGFEKTSLLRLVKFENKIVFDITSKAPGRGAYICRNIECLNKVKKTRRFNRVFKGPVEEKIYDILAGEIEKEI